MKFKCNSADIDLPQGNEKQKSKIQEQELQALLQQTSRKAPENSQSLYAFDYCTGY